jgi:hypothetical protein
MLPIVVVLALLAVHVSGFRLNPHRLTVGVRGAARGAAVPVREKLKLFAATYIELVPPMPKNRYVVQQNCPRGELTLILNPRPSTLNPQHAA